MPLFCVSYPCDCPAPAGQLKAQGRQAWRAAQDVQHGLQGLRLSAAECVRRLETAGARARIHRCRPARSWRLHAWVAQPPAPPPTVGRCTLRVLQCSAARGGGRRVVQAKWMPAWLKAASSARKSSWLIFAARLSMYPALSSTSSTCVERKEGMVCARGRWLRTLARVGGPCGLALASTCAVGAASKRRQRAQLLITWLSQPDTSGSRRGGAPHSPHPLPAKRGSL